MRHFLHHQAERHDVVCRGEGIGVAEIDLVLPRGGLVVTELHRDPHGLKHRDGLPAEIIANAVRGVIEVSGRIDRLGSGPFSGASIEQIELDFGMRIEGEAQVGRRPRVRRSTNRGSA